MRAQRLEGALRGMPPLPLPTPPPRPGAQVLPPDPDDVAAEREAEEQAEISRRVCTPGGPAGLRLQVVAALATYEALLAQREPEVLSVARARSAAIKSARAGVLEAVQRLADEAFAADAIERQLGTLLAERRRVERDLVCLVPQGYMPEAVAAALANARAAAPADEQEADSGGADVGWPLCAGGPP